MASDFRLDREARAEAVRRIQAYFEREHGEQLGQLAAGFVLDFVAEELGPLFYNAGLADAQALIARFVDSLDADIEAQRREPPRARAGSEKRPHTSSAAALSKRTSADPGAELRTERLLLRPFRLVDATGFAEFVDDEAYIRYLAPEHPDLATFMRHNLEVDWEREPSWVICLGDSVVGSAFLGVATQEGIGELAYLVSPARWGEGIATEAARAVLRYAFEERGLAKVVARADGRNSASVRVMEKLGMTREGELRAHRIDRDGVRSDELVYGITASEWTTRAAG